ncbi:MAG: hypothetical protein ACNA7T_04980 [Haliea sp.]|jgi:hypothetical protein
MTPVHPTRTLSQLALCLLLIGNLLVWSAAWNAPAFQGGEFKQLGDCSPPFLVGAGDGSSGDDACAASASSAPGLVFRSAPTLAVIDRPAAARVRISSYPVLPQAPPRLT